MFNSVFKTGIYAHYSVSSTPAFTVTPWTVYDAKSTKTKQPCSLFKFDKKLFEQFVYESMSNSFGNISRSTYKMILSEATNYVRTYVANMMKLKHPGILSVIEPLEERQNSMIFVAEHVTTDLQTYIKEALKKEGYSENELIIINGLSQICGALDFLHNNANLVHLNVIPTSIFITEKLDFRLSGFNFCEKLDPSNSNYNFIVPDERFPKFLSLNFDYSDPYLIQDHVISAANDMFSLGCLIYHLLNENPGKRLLDTNNDLYDYKAGINKLKTTKIKYKFADNFLSANFESLISVTPTLRPSIQEFKNSSFFNNELLNSLDFINNFSSKTLVEKNVFLKGFVDRKFYKRFPKFILHDKFLPILKETLSNISNLVIFPVALTCVFQATANMSNLSYISVLLEVFKPLTFKTNGKKVELNILAFTEIQLIILNNLKSILNKINTSTAGNFKKLEKAFLVPLINNILADGAMSIEQLQLEANNSTVQNAFNTVRTLGQISPEKLRIQEKFLSNLSLIILTLNKQNEAASAASSGGVAAPLAGVATNVTNALAGNANTTKFIENEIFPKVAQLFKSTTSLVIRVEVIRNLIILVKDRVLTSAFANKRILPLLLAIKQKNSQPVLNKLYDYYALYLDDDMFEKDLVVETILPELGKLAFQNNELTVAKFEEYLELIWKFQNKLKERHLVYLQKFNEGNVIKERATQLGSEPSSSVASPNIEAEPATFESILNKNSEKPNLPFVQETGSALSSPSILATASPSMGPPIGSMPAMLPLPARSVSTPARTVSTPIQSRPATPSNASPAFGVLQATRTALAAGASGIGITASQNTASNTASTIDWSLESSKINSGLLHFSSGVLQPKKAGFTTNGFGSIAPGQNVPPGFSMNVIQPLKPKNEKKDDFFDSFL